MHKKKLLIIRLSYFFMVPLFLLLLLNTLLSLFQTTYMDTNQPSSIARYKADYPIILVVFVILAVLITYFLCKKTKLMNEHHPRLLISCLAFACLFSILILNIYKATACCDSLTSAEAAVAFLGGDYSPLVGDTYLAHYIHQIGVIAYFELIFSLFGSYNYLAIQIINLLSILLIVYLLYKITLLLFNNPVIANITALLSMGLFTLFSYVTFVYGDILGFALSLTAITFLIYYLKENKIVYLVLCSVLLGLSMLVRTNNMIILIAVFIILLLNAVLQHHRATVLYAIILMAIALFISNLPQLYYRQVSKVEPFPEGSPKVSWIAMALQENDGVEDGWYNGYNWSVLNDNQFDTAKAKEACYASIKDSLSTYIAEPKRGARFFLNKFKSQWNDPGYQSQINNEWASRHQDSYTDFYNWLVFGQGKLVLEWMMNLFQFLILLGTLIAIPNLLKSKNWDLPKLILPLCIFGGYLFHLIWEAQGRYALPYFVMMLPLAAAGIYRIICLISHKNCKL